MDRLIDEVLTRKSREEKRWKNEVEYERKEARIMSKREKVRKPIKRARLKLWRQEALKASLHVTSEGAKGGCSGANRRLTRS